MEGVGTGQQRNRFLIGWYNFLFFLLFFLASGARGAEKSITDNCIGKVINVKLF